MSIYVYVDMCIYVYVDMSIYAYVDMNIYAYVDMSIYAYVDMSIYAYVDMNIYAYVDMCIYVYVDISIYTSQYGDPCRAKEIKEFGQHWMLHFQAKLSAHRRFASPALDQTCRCISDSLLAYRLKPPPATNCEPHYTVLCKTQGHVL